MLFRRADLEGIAAGEITIAFRRGRRRRARPGSTQLTPVGVLRIESVEAVEPDAVPAEDLARAGRPDRAALLAGGPEDGVLYRIALRLEGPDPRIALREDAALGDEARAELDVRLAHMDRSRRSGPWTGAVLALIAERPAVRAADLAAELGRDDLRAFKADVRKLKALGLTESLETGYRLSPRGRAYLSGS